MEVIYILIIASFALAAGFLVAFVVSAKSGQFDDQETPAIRMLFDDEIKKNEN